MADNQRTIIELHDNALGALWGEIDRKWRLRACNIADLSGLYSLLDFVRSLQSISTDSFGEIVDIATLTGSTMYEDLLDEV